MFLTEAYKSQLTVDERYRMKYPKIEWGTMEAIINKLGGEEGVEKFLRGEITISQPTRLWREQDGVIYFTLPATDGTTGEGWIKRLEVKGFRLSDYAKSVLRSPDFKSTIGVVNEMAILKGELFQDDKRITRNIRTEASKRKLTKPNAEVSCLIRETFSDKEIEEMGLVYIVTMHEPIKDSDGFLSLLDADRGDGGRWLVACYDRLFGRWLRESGFGFVVLQVSPQN